MNTNLQEYLDHWLSLARHTPLGVLCDLDGTLIPFSSTPSESHLPPEMSDLLTEIASLPGVRMTIVSGRPRDDLERLVGAIPQVWLMAEHGAWRRESAWESLNELAAGEIEGLTERLREIAAGAPGALVEPKTWAVTFHYRRIPEFEREAVLVEVSATIDEWLASHRAFERLDGVDVIEVRPRRVRKGLAVEWLRSQLGPEARLLALGDDLTDEDMFRELGVADEAVLVGSARRSHARWRLDGPPETEAMMRWLGQTRSGLDGAAAVLPEPLVVGAYRRKETEALYDLLVISNRLPDLRQGEDEAIGRKRNVGGLVSALEPALSVRRGLWLGWSGQTVDDIELAENGLDDSGTPALAWVDLSEEWYRDYYNGFSNRTLWPLFHTFPQHVSFSDKEWDCYREVNRMFARVATELVSPQTPIWVQDYHLLLAGQRLRELGHEGPIGHFLHIPFPPPDVYCLLPWAEQVLDALLDYDLLGFHTANDAANFRQTVGALTPAQVSDESVEHRGRRIQVRAFPIGITPEQFSRQNDSEAADEVEALLRATAPARLIVGADRLDYTKGIPERLEAFGRLLQEFPEWRGQVALLQISVPSREDVPEYIEQRQRIETIVGRINGEYGEAAWVPVRYLYRSYSPDQLAALYRAAAVGYVTPLRDGMNLVAKEYVASQNAEDPGVLVLSRFAGAAAELKDAVLTNPWHAEGVARDLDRALRMDLPERQERHQRLLAAVIRTTAATWAEDFLEALTAFR